MNPSFTPSLRRFALVALPLLALLGGRVGEGSAQVVEERFPGVSLGLTYDSRPLPALAIQPFTALPGAGGSPTQIENIVTRDLGYSNRFNVIGSLPSVLGRDEVDYALWDQAGASWLLTGRLEGTGASTALLLELHDVVYRQVRERGRFPVPAADSPDFRLAVHIASDAVVQWAFGEPGIAATRIAFSRRMDDGTQDIWLVDSDGEGLRRLTRHQPIGLGQAISMSPTWSPDGSRIAYMSYKDLGMPRIYELNVRTGEERAVPAGRDGDYITPAYHPDGSRLFFSVNGGGTNGIYSYDIARQCCFTTFFEGRSSDISPTFSPDGRRIAFNSTRLSVGAPQIYTMAAEGSARPEILSPYAYDRPGFYTSPDWAPMGGRVAFHGRVFQRGAHQILVADVERRGPLVQLTTEGVNEDPSWGPDGRHLVYVGVRSTGYGLYITDSVTGRTRIIVSGIQPNLPAWSPSLSLP